MINSTLHLIVVKIGNVEAKKLAEGLKINSTLTNLNLWDNNKY